MGVKIINNKIRICLTIIVGSLLLTTIIPMSIIAEYKQPVDVNSYSTITITFNKDDFEFKKYNGYDIISYLDGGLTTDIGKPMLPLKNILVAIPNEVTATNVRILETIQEDMLYTYNILPAQPPQKVGLSINKPTVLQNIDNIEFTKIYPSEKVKFIGMTDFAGQGIAKIIIYPFQYNPYLKTLKFLKQVKFVIEGKSGYTCGDYLPAYSSENEKELYKEKLKEMVVNPYDIVLKTKKESQLLDFETEDYDYVIITKNDWVSAFQPLADWKTQKGIPAKIVTTESIYANYNGSTNQEKIKAFIQDAHINWSTTFFLLGGDTDTIPYYTVNYEGDNIPTDTYYSDYDNDWICEVNVGRASITGTGAGAGKIDNFINKTLNYEKNPPATNYAKNISLFGFDLDSVTDGEDCKIDIDDLYIPSNWTVTKVYDSDSGNHEDNVDAAVNAGQNFINHIDHSNQYYMGTGYVNHNWGLDNSEVDAFSNGNKQSTWYSIGCWAAAFDYDNCIAEHFVRDVDGGGVGFVGNTRYGWYMKYYDDYASLRYDRYFFRSFFDQNHYKLGDLFSDHKMDAYNSMDQDDYNKYIFSELSLLGDPELPLWMNDPASFVVFHPDEIPTGSYSFNIHVETVNGSDIENASICLWKGDEVYLTNHTNSSGDATFNTSPTTAGNMTVTVTKQDYIPYEGNINVTINQAPNTPSNPNPEDDETDVDIDSDLSWTCSDPDGNSLTYDIYFGTSSPPPLVSSNHPITSYEPGTMNYSTTYYWQIEAEDFYGLATMGPEWSFTTEDQPVNYPPDFSDENPLNDSIDVPINTSLLSVFISDPEGDSFNWTIETSPNIGSFSGNVDNNGTKTCSVSSLEKNTLYTWYVNATDSFSGKTTQEVYIFTTEIEKNPPNKPTISGPTNGKPGISYVYTFTSIDPNGDEVFYSITWGDGTSDGWLGPYASGDNIKISHSWSKTGTYIIQAQAKDTSDLISDWGKLTIIIPKNKAINLNTLILKIFEKFPLLERLLNLL